VTATRELYLAEETLHRVAIRSDFRADRLQGDPVAQDPVFRLVDLSHSSLSEKPHDPESVGEEVSGSEDRRSPGTAFGAAGDAGGCEDGRLIFGSDEVRIWFLLRPVRRRAVRG
jgi:hypothetical protein